MRPTPLAFPNRINLHVACFLLLCMFLHWAVSPASIAQETIAERKDAVRAFFRDADVGKNYAAATGKILFPDTRADGLQMLEELTTTISPDVIERYRMTAAYLHLHQLISDSMRQRIEYIWGHIPVHPFDGEHERVAYHTALHLMTRHAGEDAVFFNGKSMRENERESRAFLLDWIREVTELGQRDFDSPTYGAVTIAAMLLLRDFALDEDLRRAADLMAHWLLADFAHDYLNGSYCGAHAREHMNSAMNPVASDMSGLGWLYFSESHRMYGREQFLAALSDFEPHSTIVEIATRRAKPFESWERKRTARIYRNARNFTLHPDPARATEDVVRYTYMDPLYAIGSIPGGLVQPREQHSWDVTWISDHPEEPATFFLMHPYSDPDALRPFMPHSADLALRNTGLHDPYFGTVTKMVGGSPFEDVFQYKNTLIALYDIGKISRFPVITGFMPLDLQSLDIDSTETQWITINTGDVYIGMYPL
ncbi:MAG: hypothetical protein KFH87_08360, partial [Bacteroidetes bacterium]|nr:hypothetical protein [Bacteroidota bacterium]